MYVGECQNLTDSIYSTGLSRDQHADSTHLERDVSADKSADHHADNIYLLLDDLRTLDNLVYGSGAPKGVGLIRRVQSSRAG
jgi:hypothetical protein